MRLEAFHLARAHWSRDADREALRAVRLEVFVHEQQVPEALEWDELDAEAIHVLARDEAGQPVGCGRLTTERKIGRMAVRRPWRGSGAGAALLRELVAQARALGWPEVALDAQVQAIGFYEREGFVAEGEVFDDAGIPHRRMRRALAPTAPIADARPAPARLPAGNRHELAASRLQLLAAARRQVAIRLPRLGPDAYQDEAELAELRRLAVAGRGAQIRLLLGDPAAALREGHRLVALAQRLPSVIQIRVPTAEGELADLSACLLTDTGGYLFQADAAQPAGHGALEDRAAQAPLRRQFEAAWERAVRATAIQPLDI
ncbi:GNAT family N-acetyltransferase [Frateuria defendens]|uniref:GNAT family N-acetyltransferase n=1 Tax=Frateuria defendens TaxID=2219559 RepID=UPI00066FE399|nr:GNAT family N-acetyltransferase [Frateuria defendens]